MNVKTILCPVDYSDGSRFALKFAEKLARESNAEIHVIICYTDVVPYETGLGSIAYEDINVDDENRKLRSFAPETKGISYRYDVIKGRIGPAIKQYAESHSIDLIVIGSHGRSGLSRLLLGSVAEDVLRHADCAVLVIREPKE